MRKILFLGMGVMGKYMASNLAKTTSENLVTVWNRTPKTIGVQYAKSHGCIITENLWDVDFKELDFVCFCVTDATAIHQIIDEHIELFRMLSPKTYMLDFSTIGKAESLKLTRKCLEQFGCHFVDIPVSGGDVGAQNGTLTMMVGGAEEELISEIPCLKLMGKNLNFLGERGMGQAVKSVNQLLCAVHMQAIREGFILADKLGVDRQSVVDICSTGAAGSWALKNLGQDIVNANFDPGFMIKHLLKDLNIFKDEYIHAPETYPALNQAIENFEAVSDKDLGTQAMCAKI